jgi:hypothetical protein
MTLLWKGNAQKLLQGRVAQTVRNMQQRRIQICTPRRRTYEMIWPRNMVAHRILKAGLVGAQKDVSIPFCTARDRYTAVVL